MSILFPIFVLVLPLHAGGAPSTAAAESVPNAQNEAEIQDAEQPSPPASPEDNTADNAAAAQRSAEVTADNAATAQSSTGGTAKNNATAQNTTGSTATSLRLNGCGQTLRPAPTPVTVSATNTLTSVYVGDNGGTNEKLTGDDDQFWTFRNDLYLQTRNRYIDAGLVLSAVLFHLAPASVPYEAFYNNPAIKWTPGVSQGYTLLNYSNDYRVERLYATINLNKRTKITIGDFYASLGRGMALSIVKKQDIGVHNTLRGVRVDYRIPRRFEGVLLGGVVNARNIDTLTHQVQKDDPLDRIAGARFKFDLSDSVNLSVHGVAQDPRYTSTDQIVEERLYVDQSPGVAIISGGAATEMFLGDFHLYLEGNAQRHSDYRVSGDPLLDETGYAVFGDVSYQLSPFSFKLEGIFYRRWLMEGPRRGSAPGPQGFGLSQPLVYHNLVTLETQWMIIKSLGNAEGGRFTTDLFLKASNTQFALSSGLIKYEGGLQPNGKWTDHGDTLIVHPILEVRQIFGDTGVQTVLEGGYRHETATAGEAKTGRLWHAKLDTSVRLAGLHSMELVGELRRHELAITEDTEYWVTLASLGYEWSGKFGLSINHEYSDQLAGFKGKIGSWTLPWPERHYIFLMGHYHFPKPLDALSLRAFGGSQRGGFKCIGGVCREYPDTVGAWVEAVYRF